MAAWSNFRGGRHPGENRHAPGDRPTASGNRIETAGVQRVALEEPAQREPHSNQRAALPHGLGRIDRAGRMKPAAASRAKHNRQHWRQRFPVEPDQAEQDAAGRATAWSKLREIALMRYLL